MDPPDERVLIPPDANRVAARALVLAAVSCRALAERDAADSGTEDFRRRIADWLGAMGLANEIEPAEATLIYTEVGELDGKTADDASWRSEGMAVLAWALGCADLPPVHVECDSNATADAMGFLDDWEDTTLNGPDLRAWDEIQAWADTYLTLHWRLRQFSEEPGPIDFPAYVSACNWGPLRLDYLEIVDGDLAFDGVRIDQLADGAVNHALGIAQERHQAFNWLLGFDPRYSAVSTDT